MKCYGSDCFRSVPGSEIPGLNRFATDICIRGTNRIVATLSRSVQIVYAGRHRERQRCYQRRFVFFFFLLLQIKFSKYVNYQTFLLEYLISISSICFFFYNRCLNWLSVRISGALNLSSQNCRCVVNHFTVHCSISSFFNIVQVFLIKKKKYIQYVV